MTEQQLLEATERIVLFTFEGEEELVNAWVLDGRAVIEYDDHFSSTRMHRMLVAAGAEGLGVLIVRTPFGNRYDLAPMHTANPILDLMNEYEVWKQQQRKQTH